MVGIVFRFPELPCPICGTPAMTVCHGPAMGGSAYRRTDIQYQVLKTRLKPNGDFTSEDCGHTWQPNLSTPPP